MRLTSALLVRLGLVMLILAALTRLLPMPDRADAVADDFAIVVSLVLVLTAAIHLRLTRETETPGQGQAAAGPRQASQRHGDIPRNASYSLKGDASEKQIR
ncbi:MAG TPA: hypothetical protein VK817_06760 [Trebonia sp.]|nr:hypothetical protein [Trebonia sp.]